MAEVCRTRAASALLSSILAARLSVLDEASGGGLWGLQIIGHMLRVPEPIRERLAIEIYQVDESGAVSRR